MSEGAEKRPRARPLRREAARVEPPKPTIDGVLSHWLVKIIATALLALAGYVYNNQLASIFASIEKQTDAVTELKADVSEFKAEQRSFQNVTTAQYTSLETRVGSIERTMAAEKEIEKERFADWQRTYQKWLENEGALRRGR